MVIAKLPNSFIKASNKNHYKFQDFLMFLFLTPNICVAKNHSKRFKFGPRIVSMFAPISFA